MKVRKREKEKKDKEEKGTGVSNVEEQREYNS